MAAWRLALELAEFQVEVSRIIALPDRSRGVALIALGALLFAIMGAMAKGASASIPTFELVAARSAVTLVAMEGLRRKLQVPLVFFDWPVLASRTIAGFVAIACYFDALRFIPLGEAVLLNNMSPVLTSVAAVGLLGETLSKIRIVALVASFAGLWLLVGQRHGDSTQNYGAWLGAASAVASAWALISLKKAAKRNRSLLIVWALAATSTVGSLILADSNWIVPDSREAVLLLGTGLAAAMAQLLMTSGYRLLDASEASVYAFLTPLFSMLLGGVLFAEWPGPQAMAGGLLIVAAGIAVAVRGKPAKPA